MRYFAGGAVVFILALIVLLVVSRFTFREAKQRWLVVLSVAAALIYIYLLPSPGNNPVATLAPSDSSYRLALTGKRLVEGSSLFSRIFPGMKTDSFWVVLPRAEGIVTVKSEVPHSGDYHIFGRVVFTEASARVEFFYDNISNSSTDPLDWNGTYELVRFADSRQTGSKQ